MVKWNVWFLRSKSKMLETVEASEIYNFIMCLSLFILQHIYCNEIFMELL